MFRVDFSDLSLSPNGRPLREMKADPEEPTATLQGNVTMHVSGVEFPLAKPDGRMWLNAWLLAVLRLPIALLSKSGSRYHLSDPYGGVSELKFARNADTVTIIQPGTKKRADISYDEMVKGLSEFKEQLKRTLLDQAPRDAVAEWWSNTFLKDLED
jgi:hypothetical protein